MTGAAAMVVVGGAASFDVAVTSESVSAYANSGAAANLTTGNVTASASGGVVPYTYAWSQVGISGYTWTINSPAAASTTFTCQTLPAGAFADATFRVTVTDAAGSTSTRDVSATANNGIPYDPHGRDTIDRGTQ